MVAACRWKLTMTTSKLLSEVFSCVRLKYYQIDGGLIKNASRVACGVSGNREILTIHLRQGYGGQAKDTKEEKK